ncbi:hypothetical protein [Nitratireductor sp. OM-1]|uniref:hypothetical protein n=1 Tax=Nitratireductor sp. OM-1 TaxID=1756988 RepID=UPI000DDC362E|nr:hypothetical protein [Nitratireductor sp. OM-1]
MKILKAALTAALVSLAAPSYAQSSNDETDKCYAIGHLAKGLMKARQAGVPIGKTMEIARSSTDAAVTRLAEEMVIMAYDRPRYSTDSAQERAVSDFINDAQLMCYKVSR